MIEGFRRPGYPVWPDVTLTGDEFVHIGALQGETIPGSPPAHGWSRVPRGMRSPDCEICRSINDRFEEFLAYIDAHGLDR